MLQYVVATPAHLPGSKDVRLRETGQAPDLEVDHEALVVAGTFAVIGQIQPLEVAPQDLLATGIFFEILDVDRDDSNVHVEPVVTLRLRLLTREVDPCGQLCPERYQRRGCPMVAAPEGPEPGFTDEIAVEGAGVSGDLVRSVPSFRCCVRRPKRSILHPNI